MIESKHGQHTAGFSFFGAIGIVVMKIAGGADAAVVDFFNAERATLTDDFGGEIDFVVRRANARTELHDHLHGIGAEAINHLSDRVRDDAELGAFASGMHKADRRRFRIDDVTRATVGDVNAERDAVLIRDNAVARGEFAAHRAAATAIDNGDVVSVDLFCSKERPIADPDRVANFTMRGVEPLQHFAFIV